MTSSQPKLVVILGPTASGKSDLGMKLAENYGGEIICADSRTVYRGMDIGTAKPSLVDQARVRHWGLDLVDPGEGYSAAQFKAMALEAIDDISGRGRLPIMVGGSGLYIDGVLFDYQFPSAAQEQQRASLAAMNHEQLLGILRVNNPHKYQSIDTANKRRIIRAIENTDNSESRSTIIRNNTLVIGLRLNKEVIHNRVSCRAQHMLQQGIIQEVQCIGQEFGWGSEAMSGVVYRVFSDVVNTPILNSEIITRATERVVSGDMKLVKKQMTWFRNNQNTIWLEADNADQLFAESSELVRQFLAS
jgi:tRNA dimethylallyltransferase